MKTIVSQSCKSWNALKPEIKTVIKENGLPIIKVKKIVNSTLGSGEDVFSSKECNLFVSEIKVSPQPSERRFYISIRRIGAFKNEGEIKLNQISLEKNELEQLRDELNKILKSQ